MSAEMDRDALARVRAVCDRLDRRIEAAGFDPLDVLTVETMAEAERLGFLDGLRTVVAQVQHAFQEPHNRDLTASEVGSVPTEDCRVYWGSHGCDLARGHNGPHTCDCCDCPDHEGNNGVRTDWTEDEPGGGVWLCVGRPPYYGSETRFTGEDA